MWGGEVTLLTDTRLGPDSRCFAGSPCRSCLGILLLPSRLYAHLCKRLFVVGRADCLGTFLRRKALRRGPWTAHFTEKSKAEAAEPVLLH